MSDSNKKIRYIGSFLIGLLLLFMAIIFTLCPLWEDIPSDWTIMDTILSILLLFVIYGLGIGSMLSITGKKRLENRVINWTLLVFCCFITIVLLKPDPDNNQIYQKFSATRATTVFFVIGYGLMLSIGTLKEKKTKDDLLESITLIVIWPFLFFIKSPLIATILFSAVAGIAYLGEWIGLKFHHPYIGALGLMITINIGLVLLAIKLHKPKQVG